MARDIIKVGIVPFIGLINLAALCGQWVAAAALRRSAGFFALPLLLRACSGRLRLPCEGLRKYGPAKAIIKRRHRYVLAGMLY